MMKCSWATDVYGFYLLPFIAYSNTPRYGRAFWFGIGPWLWMCSERDSGNGNGGA